MAELADAGDLKDSATPKGASREEVLSSLRDRNQARCKSLLDDAELKRIAESAVRYDPMAHLSDMGTTISVRV